MRALVYPIFLAFATLLHAADLRPVSCRFLSLGAAGDVASVITPSDKGAEIACPLPSDGLSQKIVCFANSNAINFLSASDKKPVAAATIPAGVKAALLIFVQTPRKPEEAPSQPSAWRIFVIEDSPKNFPDGGAYVGNFSDSDIRYSIGEHKGVLHAAGSQGFPLPAQRDSFNMAPVVFEILQDDKWQTANETALRFLSGTRYLIFASQDPASGRPRITTYQDFPPAVPAKGKH